MSLLKARYIPDIDKIVGCNPGELVWYHERFHQMLEQRAQYYTEVQPMLMKDLITYSFVLVALNMILESSFLIWFILCIWFIFRSWDELAAWAFALVSYPIEVKGNGISKYL